MTSPSLPNETFHLAALRALDLLTPPDGWSLQPISRNHERITHGISAQYVLMAPDRPHQVLYVGPDLSDLAARSRLFAAAYPNLACAIVGEGTHQGWHYLLFEYFTGRPAIDVLGQSADGPQRVLAALRQVAGLFAAAERPSTAEAARAELDELGREVLALPYWTQLDRSYLEASVLPFLREQLISLQPTRRATNGDLILRNLLIDDAGAVRIIDYEFGSDTHFHREDWLRLTYWDVLPEVIRGFALDRAGTLPPLRVFLALKQMVTEAMSNLPQKAVTDIRHWTSIIRQTLAATTSHHRQSLFWPAAETASTSEGELQAQLFWMTDAGWSQEHSAAVAVRTGPHQTVRFQIPAGDAVHAIRLDPMNAPGVATVFNLVVRRLDPAPEITFSAFGPEALAMSVPAGDAIACPTTAGDNFQIISTGPDPQLHFNHAGGPANCRLEVEATFSLSIDPVDQVPLLRALAEKSRFAAAAAAAAPATADDRTGAIAALAGQLHQWFTGEDGLRARLMAEFALQRKADQTEQATVASLTIAQSLLNERTEHLGQLREQVSGYAATIDRLEVALVATNEELARHIRMREEALSHQRAAEDQLGRLSQQLAAASERAAVLAQELEVSRRPKGWFSR